MLAGDFLRESANFTPELASSGNAKLDEINKASASFMKKVPGLNGGVDRTITNNCAMQAQSIKAINGASSLQIIVDFYVAGIAKDSKTKKQNFQIRCRIQLQLRVETRRLYEERGGQLILEQDEYVEEPDDRSQL